MSLLIAVCIVVAILIVWAVTLTLAWIDGYDAGHERAEQEQVLLGRMRGR